MRRADIALWSRIPTGVDYIFTLPQLVIEARGQRVITRIDLPVVGRATLSHGSVGRADQSLLGQILLLEETSTSHGVVRSGVHRYKLALLPGVSTRYTLCD